MNQKKNKEPDFDLLLSAFADGELEEATADHDALRDEIARNPNAGRIATMYQQWNKDIQNLPFEKPTENDWARRESPWETHRDVNVSEAAKLWPSWLVWATTAAVVLAVLSTIKWKNPTSSNTPEKNEDSFTGSPVKAEKPAKSSGDSLYMFCHKLGWKETPSVALLCASVDGGENWKNVELPKGDCYALFAEEGKIHSCLKTEKGFDLHAFDAAKSKWNLLKSFDLVPEIIQVRSLPLSKPGVMILAAHPGGMDGWSYFTSADGAITWEQLDESKYQAWENDERETSAKLRGVLPTGERWWTTKFSTRLSADLADLLKSIDENRPVAIDAMALNPDNEKEILAVLAISEPAGMTDDIKPADNHLIYSNNGGEDWSLLGKESVKAPAGAFGPGGLCVMGGGKTLSAYLQMSFCNGFDSETGFVGDLLHRAGIGKDGIEPLKKLQDCASLRTQLNQKDLFHKTEFRYTLIGGAKTWKICPAR